MININTAALRLGMCEKETPGREVDFSFEGGWAPRGGAKFLRGGLAVLKKFRPKILYDS